MMQRRIAAGALLVALLPLGASAGTLMSGRSTEAGNPGAVETWKVQIDRGRLRAEPEGQDMVIFRGDRRLIWGIDPKAKTYNETTRADLDRMAKEIGGGRDQMRAQLENLPPDQRKAVEQMMPQVPGWGTTPATPVTFKKVRSGLKVGRWTCDHYDGYRGTEKQTEICVADRQQLGISADDFQTMQQFVEFAGGLASAFGALPWMVSPQDPQKGGFPGVIIRAVVYDKGKVDNTFEVTEVRSQSIADSAFEVPAGFTKETP